MRIIVTGGTGLLGRRLLPALMGRNHGVVVASRDPERARRTLPAGVAACPLSGPGLLEALAGSGAVFNLAGEPVVEGRWSPEKKERIRDSRAGRTRALVAEIASLPPAQRPRVLVSASATGWYGETGEDTRDETAPPAADFLGVTCSEWEVAAREAQALGMRVVLARMGVVLAREGGALATLERVFRAFVGAPLGNGVNWMSWIHIEDAVEMLAFALEVDSVRGPMNVVAPEPVRQLALCRALARKLHRPCWPGVPRPLVRLLFGEKADVLLSSQRIVPRVAREGRFAFRHPTLDQALADLY